MHLMVVFLTINHQCVARNNLKECYFTCYLSYRYLNYVPGANLVSSVYNIQDILWFQYMVHVM